MSEFLESNHLLPESQHGFRPKRSTMTAWEAIQLDWAQNSEKNDISGILLWDLSAAFDTLDVDIFCEKIIIFKECFVTILKVLQNKTTITASMSLTYLLRVKL